VSEKDLAKLTRKATKKSDYGHLKLYDSIEWRPISKHDYLIDLIRDGKKGLDYWIWEKKRFLYTPSKDIDWMWIDNTLVGRGKYAKDFHIYGWATLTKEL
jgi:hypothetical protein